MDFDFSEPLSELLLLLRREILVSEEHHASLCNQ
jgi:hypothetical protein